MSYVEEKAKSAYDKIEDSVKAFVSSPVDLVVNTAQALGQGFQGDWSQAAKELGQAGGAFADLVTAGTASTQYNEGELGVLFRSSDFNKYTLGTGTNIAQSSEGFKEIRETGEMTPEQWKNLGVLTAKAGIVVGGAAAAPGALTGAQIGTAATTFGKTAVLSGFQQDLRGWGADEAADIVGIYGAQNFTQPKSWVTDLLGAIGGGLNAALNQPESLVVTEHNPYSYQGNMDQGMQGQQTSLLIPTIASVALIGAMVLILKRK